MKFKKLMSMSIEGCYQAIQMGLDKEENWTPLLVHLHTSRLLVGAWMGFFIGLGTGVGLSFIFLRGI